MGRGDFFQEDRVPTREERLEYLRKYREDLLTNLARIEQEITKLEIKKAAR